MTDPMADLKRALADAARALVALDESFRRERGLPNEDAARSSTGMPGADVLLAFLARQSAIPAPVETRESARAILAAIAAVDALEDAVVDARESTPRAR